MTTMASQGIDGNIGSYASQAAYSLFGNITGSTAAPVAVSQIQAIALLSPVAFVSGSNATTTTQALSNIAGLTLPLVAGATYIFNAVLMCLTSADANGIQFGVQYSVGGGSVVAQCSGALTTATAQSVMISALNTATASFMTSSAQTGGIFLAGQLVTTTTAGNLTMQFLKPTAGTATVYIGSYLQAIRVA
jgi:hypothetical protein